MYQYLSTSFSDKSLCPYLQSPCQWIYFWNTSRCWLSDQRLLISLLPSYIKKKKIKQEETNNQDRLNVEYDSVSRGRNTILHKATQFLEQQFRVKVSKKWKHTFKSERSNCFLQFWCKQNNKICSTLIPQLSSNRKSSGLL